VCALVCVKACVCACVCMLVFVRVSACYFASEEKVGCAPMYVLLCGHVICVVKEHELLEDVLLYWTCPVTASAIYI